MPLAAAGILLLAGCGSTPVGGGGRSGGAVLFYDPSPKSLAGGAKDGPREWVFISSEPGTDAETGPLTVTSGSRGWDPDGGPPVPTEEEGAWKRLGRSPTRAPGAERVVTTLSPHAFEQLIAELEEAGIFELPRAPGGSPPSNRAYFVIQTGRGEPVTIPKADGATLARLFPAHREAELSLVWRKAIIVATRYLSAY